MISLHVGRSLIRGARLAGFIEGMRQGARCSRVLDPKLLERATKIDDACCEADDRLGLKGLQPSELLA
jgi:hypothetical protein